MAAKKYIYSEIFNSIQGEGHHTGVPTCWIRFFMCNLQCDGFGQLEPTKPDTYELPYEHFDAKSVDRVEDLPVWDKGCDSSYTWSKKFKHLMGTETGPVLAQKLCDVMKNDHNPEGLFKHPVSGHRNHLCITGGEPLMRHAQNAFLEIYDTLSSMENLPSSVTWETNGTQVLSDDFFGLVSSDEMMPEAFFSVSPKLWTVAGEKRAKAIKPEIVKQYQDASSAGQLKFVVGHRKEQWEELDEVVSMYREAGVLYPVWIMPVGAREEEQRESAGDVAKMAFERGYNVAGRMHVYLFGNAIGT
jgi:7-carboxy-7-deazaguanine synthase